MPMIAEDIKKLQDTGESLPPNKLIDDLKHVLVEERKKSLNHCLENLQPKRKSMIKELITTISTDPNSQEPM